ncbi:MAG: TetR/AcrR family transcriptional regulator [bacterium JZ-2024 1]
MALKKTGWHRSEVVRFRPRNSESVDEGAPHAPAPLRKGEATREKILSAASDLFCEKGIFKTTLDEIADRAGVAKGTIYLYIKQKEDLLVLIVQRGVDQMMEKMESLVASDMPADVALRVAYDTLYERVTDLRQAGTLLSLSDFAGLPPEIIHRINEQKLRPLKVIENLVARGIREKTFRRTVSPRLIAFLFFAFFGALLHREWMPAGIEPEAAGEQFWKFVKNALMR